MPRPYTRYPCGIYGPRNLVRRHAYKLKQQLRARALGQIAIEPPILPPGQEQLFSFYAPALEAGLYKVTLEQDIVSSTTSEELTLPLKTDKAITQSFEVVAPRFTLPDDAVHSSYPPQGYGALANTLPHVVLTDPHLPWDRIASALPNKTSLDWGRNQVPWLALVVFTADELTLSADQLTGPGSLFANTSLGKSSVVQSQTFTTNIKVSDVPNIISTISPISSLPSEPSDGETTDVVFVPGGLFSELFTNYDSNGSPMAQTGPDVSRYKYLAHARDINTTGMADAGVEDNGVFGIILSHRTGPLSNTQPQPVVVHLMSIEGVESDMMNKNWPIDPTKFSHVAMSSLHSWNFVTLPEGSFSIETTLKNLGLGANVLRAPDSVINNVDTSTTMGSRLQKRLLDGYTLTRQRSMTGEILAAIYRGPLTPTLVPYPLLPGEQGQAGSTWLSNSGIDLQIMDPEIGIMDVTYSVAWQLGKTLAVADQVFTTALGKLRTAIYTGAMNDAKAEILRQHDAYKTREETAVSLKKTIPELSSLHKVRKGLYGTGGSIGDRWQRPQADHLDLSYYSPLIQDIFQKHANALGACLMRSSDGDGSERYDEQNSPVSVDWMMVLKWVQDKMSLYNIPAHYFIIDPTFLASETLRFFHVDRNWTDALIDGALSLGNHLSGVDKVRQTIHEMIGEYLYPSPPVTPMPQIPIYGFLMHSEAVTQYHDLKVSVALKGVVDAAPMLRHENLDVSKGVMICLLDQVPGDPGLQSITFTQPPHQQSFVAGAELDSHHISTLYKQIFTLADQAPNPAPWGSHHWMRPDDPNQPVPQPAPDPPQDKDVSHSAAVFKWGVQPAPEVRTLLPTAWANDVNTFLNIFGVNPKDPNNPFYKDTIPNAAMAGIQLNNPIYQLVIGQPPDSSVHSKASTTVPFPPCKTQATTVAPSMSQARKDKTPNLTTRSSQKLPLRSISKPASTQSRTSVPSIGSGFKLGPSHGRATNPPPHYRPLRSPRVRELPADKPLPGAGSGPPSYIINCFPVDSNPKDPGIPCGTGIPKDLVFTVVQNQTPFGSNYNLQEYKIALQLGNSKPPRHTTCLLDDYTGPGPFMTSNVRFNVLAQVENDPQNGTTLALRVIPRSTKGSAVPSMCREMSFILPVCLILPHDITKKIPLLVTPKYVDFQPVMTPNYNAITFPQN